MGVAHLERAAHLEQGGNVGSGEAVIAIDHPVDAAWKYIGNFADLDKWMPGVDSCVVDGDVRTLSVLGMDITERLLKRDDDEHVLEYTIESSPLQAESHLGRISVHEDGSGSRVTWFVEVTPDHLTELLVGTYQQALDALKKQLDEQI